MDVTTTAIFALLLAVQDAPATAPPPVVLTWSSRPTGDDVAAVYPPAAEKDNQSGAATMKCAFAADGRLRDCRILAEQPEGYGFGDAFLRLARRFRVDMNKSVHPAAGNTTILSMRFVTPGQTQAVRLKLQPGEAASLVTVLNGPAPRGAVTVVCASPAAPERRCQLHPFEWATMPTIARSIALLRETDQKEGVALMECKVTTTGELDGCKIAGASPRNVAALLKLSSDFRAPSTAIDGAAVHGGRVVLRFDWKLFVEMWGEGAEGSAAPARPRQEPAEPQ